METVYVRMTRFNLSELNCSSLRFVILNCNLQSSLIYYNLDCSSRCPHPYVFVRACMRARVGVRLCACVHVCISPKATNSFIFLYLHFPYCLPHILNSAAAAERCCAGETPGGECGEWHHMLRLMIIFVTGYLISFVKISKMANDNFIIFFIPQCDVIRLCKLYSTKTSSHFGSALYVLFYFF